MPSGCDKCKPLALCGFASRRDSVPTAQITFGREYLPPHPLLAGINWESVWGWLHPSPTGLSRLSLALFLAPAATPQGTGTGEEQLEGLH